MHESFRAATQTAAALLDHAARADGRSSLLEADLDRAFVGALRGLTDAPVLARRQRWLPGWDPQPGQIDLLVEHAGRTSSRLRFAAELKWCNDNKVYEALWDLIKMTSATQIPGVEAAYLIYGAPERYWAKPVQCARELFFDPPDGRGVCVPALIQDHLAWWTKYILGDSRARFARAPRQTAIELVAAAGLRVGGRPWQIRTVAVRPVGDESVAFRDGVPVLN